MRQYQIVINDHSALQTFFPVSKFQLVTKPRF